MMYESMSILLGFLYADTKKTEEVIRKNVLRKQKWQNKTKSMQWNVKVEV